jgi:hypothetical protein
MLKVRLVRSPISKMIPRGGRLLGKVEEHFIETLVPGDTFTFAGEILKYEALVEDEVYVSRAAAESPKVPLYEGNQFPLTASLAGRLQKIIADRREWQPLPTQVREWLEIQDRRSALPAPRHLLSRPFRATASIISSAIRLRDGSPTRPSACCSRVGSNGLGCGRRASPPTNTRSRCGRWAMWRKPSNAASYRWQCCSTKTCSATISKLGWPNRR